MGTLLQCRTNGRCWGIEPRAALCRRGPLHLVCSDGGYREDRTPTPLRGTCFRDRGRRQPSAGISMDATVGFEPTSDRLGGERLSVLAWRWRCAVDTIHRPRGPFRLAGEPPPCEVHAPWGVRRESHPLIPGSQPGASAPSASDTLSQWPLARQRGTCGHPCVRRHHRNGQAGRIRTCDCPLPKRLLWPC